MSSCIVGPFRWSLVYQIDLVYLLRPMDLFLLIESPRLVYNGLEV
jgi:hypothetical protein